MKATKTFLLLLLFSTAWISDLTPQFYYYDTYFGKNKVQYNDFDWRIIETEHFQVYYYPGERQLALDAAQMAERGYGRLSRILSYEIKHPIPLVVYASHTDFQQTNITLSLIDEGVGGFTELFKSRVVLPFMGSYSQFEHVLVHELVHAFQYDILYGAGVHSLVGNPFVFRPPLWFVEGMAEYLSVGMDNHTEMWLRDASLGGYLIPLEVLDYVQDIRVYRFGQSVLHFIGQKYGDEKIGEILQKSPLYKSLDKAVKSSLGVDMKQLSKMWLEETRKRYLPQIAEYEKPSRYGKELKNHVDDLSNYNLAPSISPSGDKFVYLSDRSLYSDIYLASTQDGKDITKLVEGERSADLESLRFLRTKFTWSPDEKYIAFVAKVGNEDALYVMDIEKKKITKKLTFGFDGLYSPSWSPDAGSIAFVGLDGGASDLFVVNLETGELKRLTDDRYSDADPSWSPDGRLIAFSTDRGKETNFTTLTFGTTNIAVYDSQTEEIEILTSGEGKNLDPVFSPEGDEIAFISDRTGISNIFTVDIATKRIYQLTSVLTGVSGILEESSAISWSPQSNILLFSVFEDGGWNIYMMREPQRFKKLVPPAAEEPEMEILALKNLNGETKGENEKSNVLDKSKFVYLRDFYSDEVDTLTVFEKFEADAQESPASLLPDTTQFSLRRYKLKFTPDYVSGGAAFASNIGFAGLTQIGFSDVLGNHNIQLAANFYRSIKDSDLFFLYWYMKKRTNYGVGFFQYQNNYILFQPTSASSRDEFVTRTYRGFQALMSRPFSKFNRVELGIKGIWINDDIFQQDFLFPQMFTFQGSENLFYMAPTLALVHDNTLWGYTGPISGGRAKLEVEKTLDFSFNDISYLMVIGDWRRYYNVRQRYVFAVRVIGAMSGGPDPLAFRIGGPYTLRGLDYGELRGTRIALTNLEFRFPLIEQLSLGWPLPLSFRNIRGVFFLDIGGAWSRIDDQEVFKPFSGGSGLIKLQDLKAGYGFGMRLNLGFFVLRYDLAQPTDFSRSTGKGRSYFSLGAEY
ncbi:MAG: DPP IV N-terminal domain-containing protein [Candidatus Glassbacteria bacterium]